MRPSARRVLHWFLVVVGGLVAASGIASAHEVGVSRFQAPIPLELLYAGAGLTVAATAGWLAIGTDIGATRRASVRIGSIPRSVGRSIVYVGRLSFLVAFVLTLGLGLLGPQAAAENFATVFVWPVWLKGLAFVSALVGSPWRFLSPWRTLYDWLVQLEGEELGVVGPYPSWLGAWPAVIGFVLWVGVLENLTAVPREPMATTLLISGYAAVMLGGAIAFGDEWFDRADTLAVFYRLFGRVAPVRIEREPTAGYSLTHRPPWHGCTRRLREPALVAFVVAVLYTVSFDGFTNTAEYQSVVFSLRGVVGSGPWAGLLVYVLGLGFVAGALVLVVVLATVVAGEPDLGGGLLALAPTLIPIAVAYELAHNYPFVVRNLGRLVGILGQYVVAATVAVDPLSWLTLPMFWWSQVVLIVAGHVVAVVAAHVVTIERYHTRRTAIRAHAPMTGLMVGYTVLSLWIISRPIAT